MTNVTTDDIEQLLLLFSKKGQYDARTGEQNNEILQKCEELFQRDYICCRIENEKGALSANYPSRMIVPTEEKSQITKETELLKELSGSTNKFDASKFKEIANKSNLARCRTRFPVPVILCNGKFVCRSATLACGGEMLFRDVSGCIFNYSSTESDEKNTSVTRNGALFTELRSQDIKLLKELSVSYICDLMVENKKVKYGLKVSSSEKIDKENRYCDFKIVQLPYPGCEFFKKFKDNNYTAEGLMFDWEQNYVDSSLTLPSDSMASSLGIHWSNYKVWDLVKLTQNYLKLLVTYVIEGTSSILIHCISGWDRTPLFISLLRLSLWADGRAHTSLSAVEMAYLTLAYDWYLFGHDLPSRLKAGEEILFFCFEFLKFITSEDFSSKKRSRKISSNCADPPLDILIEEESIDRVLTSSNSSSSLHKMENGSTSIFYTCLESSQDNFSSSMFYSSIDSGDDSDSIKSVKLNSFTELYPSDSDISSTLVNSVESTSNNNGLALSSSPVPVPNARQRFDSVSSSGSRLNSFTELYSLDSDIPPTLVNSVESTSNNNGLASSSSPVPVPNARQRFDSMSSLGSWQYISGTGSLLGSVTSKCSSEINSNSSSSSNQENGNIDPSSAQERAEKLKNVRTIMHRAYRKAIENKDSANGERYSYFPWRR